MHFSEPMAFREMKCPTVKWKACMVFLLITASVMLIPICKISAIPIIAFSALTWMTEPQQQPAVEQQG